jgi:hypothetical protein
VGSATHEFAHGNIATGAFDLLLTGTGTVLGAKELSGGRGVVSGAVEGEGAVGAAPRTPIATRVEEIHGMLKPIEQIRFRTTAILDTREGTRIVAQGTRDISRAHEATLQPGEVAARLPRAHAEITALTYAAKHGLTPAEIAVSRPFCPEGTCTRAIEAAGGRLTSDRTAIFPPQH